MSWAEQHKTVLDIGKLLNEESLILGSGIKDLDEAGFDTQKLAAELLKRVIMIEDSQNAMMTAMSELGRNWFEIQYLIPNHFLTSAGVISYANTNGIYFMTPYISIPDNYHFIYHMMSIDTNTNWCWYGPTGKFISSEAPATSVQTENYILTPPEGARFLRAVVKSEDLGRAYLQLEKNEE